MDFGWRVSKTDSMYILHIEKHWDASGTELICATLLPAETQTLPSMNADQLQQPWRSTNKANNVPGGNLGKHKSVLAKTGPISCKIKTSKSTNIQHTCKTFGAEIHSFAWAEETIRKKKANVKVPLQLQIKHLQIYFPAIFHSWKTWNQLSKGLDASLSTS